MSARRAVSRWAVRTFRREWRQQLLVLIFLTLVAGGAVFTTTMAFNLASTRSDVFGDATHRFRYDVERPEELPAYVADLAAQFDAYEIVRHQRSRVPGTSQDVELRTLGDGTLSTPTLAVLDGRRPMTGREIALTDDVAALLGASVGDSVDLDGARTVVGIVENPGELGDEFSLVTDADPQIVTVLIDADDDEVRRFRSDHEPGSGFLEARNQQEKTTATVVALVVTTVALLLAALVAATGFVVLAQRRQRQLGLLGAVGATRRHLRRVVIANGTLVGLVSTAVGVAAGLGAWALTSDRFEAAAGHRLPRFDVPVIAVAATCAMAIAAATLAAWWPARVTASVPIVRAIAGRPPAPKPARRSAAIAVVLAIAGLAAIAAGNNVAADEANIPLLLGGVVAVVLAVVFGAAPAIRTLALVASRLPVPLRVAVRDLSRYRARAGAALAASSLALAIAASIVVGAAAAEHGVDEGNLGAHQLLVYADVRRDSIDEAVAPSNVERAAFEELLDGLDPISSVLALDLVTDDDGDPVVLGRPVDANTLRDTGSVFAATPAAMLYLGVDPDDVDPDVVLLTSQPGPVYLTGDVDDSPWRREPVPDHMVQRVHTPAFRSAPHALLTERGIELAGWQSTPVGWLVELDRAWTDNELATVRERAIDGDLVIEARDDQGGLSTLRTIAVVIGAVLSLSIVGMSVGLLRSETAADTRTLHAVGAPRRTRRSITAGTAGALALLAVLLGTTIGYLALVAGHRSDLARLGDPPLAHLCALAIGLPAIASTAGWLLGGREGPS